MKQAARLFGRSIGTYVIALFLSFVLLAGIGTSALWLQIVISAILLGGALYMMFADAGAKGERACTMQSTIERVRKDGKEPSADMLKECFSKKVALITYLLIASVFILVSVVNIIAAPYYPPVIISETEEISLEDAAARYENMTEEEINQAEAAAQEARSQTNYFNVATRVVFMPFFSVFQLYGNNPDGLNLLFLLLSFIIPIPAAAGYLCGPALRLKKLKAIQLGKKRKLKKLKVNQKKREVKPPKMEV